MSRAINIVILSCLALCGAAAEPPRGDYVLLPKEGGGNLAKAYRAGRADAQRDLRRNYFAVEIYGREPVYAEEYSKHAERRYGIHVKRVAGCIVDEDILGHAKGYNEISEPEIHRRFGKDVLLKAEAEVASHWEGNHRK
jgi:hypothetical protein